MPILFVCISLQEPVYQHWLTMDLWLWYRDPLKYAWGNLHLFPGNQGRDSEPWRWVWCVCVCLCMYTCVGACNEQHSFLVFTCSDTLWGRKQLVWQDRRQSDQEKHYETVQALVLNGFPAALLSFWELYAWKKVKVGPTEKKRRLGRGWTNRGIRRSSKVLPCSVEYLFLQVWIQCGRYTRTKCWRPLILSMRRTQLKRYRMYNFIHPCSTCWFMCKYQSVRKLMWLLVLKSESHQIIFYSSQGQMSLLSCFVFSGKWNFKTEVRP